ncbi:hypothetical protein CO082_03200 [Candidatus Peregrinibacteria bacterium CG_4_9_14_0_8_um_filter_44_15]|nr:MAG: hypothetical protein COZ35_03655 [Candidatus Peregrinibacteria bacterium CG_4_10_14_3_um_filter_44_21]PJB88804.1 MAG: hypothetical protein CO082_03200 [Candidatus Peregrinibacteria bacterium CG_4_9_14_0_8_um_filter_44_15]
MKTKQVNDIKHSVPLQRFLTIDLLKVFAITGMVIFHFFYILNFLGVRYADMHHGVFGILGDTVRILFISLVGVTLVLSKRKSEALGERPKEFLRRKLLQGMTVLGLALMINLVTYIVVPDQFVKFGVLHLISLGVFCGSLLAGHPYVSAQIGLGIIIIGTWLTPASEMSFISYVLGWTKETGMSLDYFPVFPWLGVVFVGMLGGHWFLEIAKKRGISRRHTDIGKKARLIHLISSKALWIYIIHIPVLLLVVYGIKMVQDGLISVFTQ